MINQIYTLAKKVNNIFFGKGSYYDLEDSFLEVYEKVKKYTMTSIERIYSLAKATEYIVQKDIAGDIVECGVYRGGSAMTCALTLVNMNMLSRNIYLYDTYKGMSEPSLKDVSQLNESAIKTWSNACNKDKSDWCYASIDAVKNNLYSTGYPEDKIKFIEGKVENTIPQTIPEKIAILRLDTDWHESTYHELRHLYPRISQGGVLIIDDYGYWKGAREAVDQYFKENDISLLLNRIDSTGRIAIKF